jgi:hypothetical protein
MTPHRSDTYGTDAELYAALQVWQHTSLGNNDGHLPQEVATLPAPTTPPATLMSAETMKVASRNAANINLAPSFASSALCWPHYPYSTVRVCRSSQRALRRRRMRRWMPGTSAMASSR